WSISGQESSRKASTSRAYRARSSRPTLATCLAGLSISLLFAVSPLLPVNRTEPRSVTASELAIGRRGALGPGNRLHHEDHATRCLLPDQAADVDCAVDRAPSPVHSRFNHLRPRGTPSQAVTHRVPERRDWEPDVEVEEMLP